MMAKTGNADTNILVAMRIFNSLQIHLTPEEYVYLKNEINNKWKHDKGESLLKGQNDPSRGIFKRETWMYGRLLDWRYRMRNRSVEYKTEHLKTVLPNRVDVKQLLSQAIDLEEERISKFKVVDMDKEHTFRETKRKTH